MMQILILDAELEGTGLYDLDGIEVDPKDLQLSDGTLNHLNGWLKEYGILLVGIHSSPDAYSALDKDGILLKKLIQKELLTLEKDCLVLYWSEGLGYYLNDDCKPIQDSSGMISSIVAYYA